MDLDNIPAISLPLSPFSLVSKWPGALSKLFYNFVLFAFSFVILLSDVRSVFGCGFLFHLWLQAAMALSSQPASQPASQPIR